jgi:hypothetical protein
LYEEWTLAAIVCTTGAGGTVPAATLEAIEGQQQQQQLCNSLVMLQDEGCSFPQL